MEDELIVREARALDLASILDLARQGELLETGIAEAIDWFLVAVRHGQIIGTCGLEEHSGDGLLRTVVVDAKHSGQAVGRALVEAALRRARERRLGSVYLLTTTAAPYFTALGFEVAPRAAAPRAIRDSWEFTTGCPASAVFMSRRP